MRLCAHMDLGCFVRRTVLVLRSLLLLGFLHKLVFVRRVCFVVRECDQYWLMDQLLLIHVGMSVDVEEDQLVYYCIRNVADSY